MKRAIELIRVSTAAQAGDDRASIPAQRVVNRKTAQAYGLVIVRSIEMSDVSGASVLQAPEIHELIQFMQSPEIHGVIAREFSRLMRPENYADYALLQVFVDTNTWLYLPEGPINFASTDGRLLGTLRAAMAGVERMDMLKKSWTAKEEKRRRGELANNSNILPFGVTYPWAYTADAERVREAFRLFLSGETSYTEVGKKVGIPMHNLRIILRNPIYTGWRVIDQKRDMTLAGKRVGRDGRQGDRRRIKRSNEEVIRVKVLEPLVGEKEFNQVQLMMDHKRVRRNVPDGLYTYKSYLSCDQCESPIYVKFKRHHYYICRSRLHREGCAAPYMNRDQAERELDRLFAKRLTSPTVLNRLVKTMRRQQPIADGDRLAAQLESLKQKRQRVLDYYFEGGINQAERDARLTQIAKDERIISEILVKHKPNPDVSADRLVDLFTVFKEFDLLNRQDKRALLGAISPNILISNYAVKGISFSLDVSPILTAQVRAERIYLPIAA